VRLGNHFLEREKRREGKQGRERSGRKGEKDKRMKSNKNKKQKQYSLSSSPGRPSFLLFTHPFNSYSVPFLTLLGCVGLP